MATEKIKLVQGDTRPKLILSMLDENTGSPIDLSGPGISVRLLFREVGSEEIKAEMPCTPIPGWLDREINEVVYDGQYSIPGTGGRVGMDWLPNALDTSGEFEAELEATFNDGTVLTAFNVLRFVVREQF